MPLKPIVWTALACLLASCEASETDSPPAGESDAGVTGDDSQGSTTGPAGSTTVGNDSLTDTDAVDGSSSGEPAPTCAFPGIDALLACPDDAPVLGGAELHAVDAFTFAWSEYDEACDSTVPAPQVFRLPDDILSLSLVATADFEVIAFAGVANGGEMLIDARFPGEGGLGEQPLKHFPGVTANLTLPMSPDTLPVAGCLAVLPVVQGDVRGSEGEIRIASRRGDALLDPAGRLTVNAIRVGNVGVSLEDIEAALGVADALYVDNGAGTLADIEFFDVTTDAGAFVPSNGAALNDLRSTPIEGSSRAMNIYFIEDFTDAPGVLGVAAGIPGPNGIPQTPGSGVVVALTSHRTVDGVVNTTLMGETIAHELGHQLGLFHTSESDGSGHDVVDDTAECTLADDANGDGQLAAEECPDGANVMFWTSASFSQSTMSASQSDVLFFSPVSE